MEWCSVRGEVPRDPHRRRWSQVTEDDMKPCEMRYNKAKDVHSIMQHVAR